jgi:hypothetical protein
LFFGNRAVLREFVSAAKEWNSVRSTDEYHVPDAVRRLVTILFFPMHRYELQDRYLELTRAELPAKARLGRWVVTNDHCFMRILLDQLFQGCWYDHLDRRLVAYKQLPTNNCLPTIERGAARSGDCDGGKVAKR